jgi:hypothetical protein
LVARWGDRVFDTIVRRDGQIEADAERGVPVAASGPGTFSADLYGRLADETLARLRITTSDRR